MLTCVCVCVCWSTTGAAAATFFYCWSIIRIESLMPTATTAVDAVAFFCLLFSGSVFCLWWRRPSLPLCFNVLHSRFLQCVLANNVDADADAAAVSMIELSSFPLNTERLYLCLCLSVCHWPHCLIGPCPLLWSVSGSVCVPGPNLCGLFLVLLHCM